MPVVPKPDEGRPETDREYHDRILEQMDEATWRGRQVINEHPPRAIIHEYQPPDEPPHHWRERKE